MSQMKCIKWMFVWSASMIVCGTAGWLTKTTWPAIASAFALGWVASAVMYVVSWMRACALRGQPEKTNGTPH